MSVKSIFSGGFAAAAAGLGSAVAIEAAPVKLSEVPDGGSADSISGFVVAPDGQHVVYASTWGTSFNHVYSARIGAAGTQVQLSAFEEEEFPNGVSSGLVRVTPDNKVVFAADFGERYDYQLYSAMIGASGTQTKLSASTMDGAVSAIHATTGNGSRVLFTAGDDLYSANPAVASSAIRVGIGWPKGPIGTATGALQVTPDGSRAVYSGEPENLNGEYRYTLFTANPAVADSQTRLSMDGAVGDALGAGVRRFSLTPDGARVVYSFQWSIPQPTYLYSQPVDGGVGDDEFLGAGLDSNHPFDITADGQRVVFLANGASDNPRQLYSNLIGGGTQTQLNDPFVSGGQISRYATAGNRVVYTGDLTTDGVTELYAASVTASGMQIKLNTTPIAGGDVDTNFRLMPDAARVIYTGDLDVNNRFELYAASTLTEGTQIKLSRFEHDNASLFTSSLTFTPDGNRVIYQGDLSSDNVVELYVASTAEADSQLRLVALPTDQDVVSFQLTPDGAYVVYAVDLPGEPVTPVGDADALYAVSIEGGTPILLNTPPPPGGRLGQYSILDDSRTVLFLQHDSSAAGTHLFSAMIPEPASVVLIVSGMAAVATRRRQGASARHA